ncbi:MAG: phosphoribosyltransferase family protein [Candidatus Pacebacteria bacterium]|nr:phosphoribosyltransferase family protein [Candidatus Paceibacterota bacterium]
MSEPHHSQNSEESGHLHYIVTEDLCPLIHHWAEKKGFIAPNPNWFGRNHQLLRTALDNVLNSGDRVVIVDSLPHRYITGTIHPFLNRLLGREIEFRSIISIDNSYLPENNFDTLSLEITRGVDAYGNDLGKIARPYCLSVQDQIEAFRKERSGINNDVVVVDDGIWTGGTIKMAIDALRYRGFNVVKVVVGVHIKNRGKVINLGIPVNHLFSVQTYEDDNRPVLDWLCERDFFPGVPFGGRTVIDKELQSFFFPEDRKTIGAFYPENKTWLKDWASINDSMNSFAAFCFSRSIALFEEIELLSGKKVLVRDLDRIPLFMAQQRPNSLESVVKIIKKKLEVIN